MFPAHDGFGLVCAINEWCHHDKRDWRDIDDDWVVARLVFRIVLSGGVSTQALDALDLGLAGLVAAVIIVSMLVPMASIRSISVILG